MKKYNFLLLFALITSLVACNQDDKPAEIILEEIEFGAVIRTLDFNNGEFEVNRPESLFSVNVEEQDRDNGGLLESLEVYLSFVDNTPENGDFSTQETLLEVLNSSDFDTGPLPDELPQNTLEYSFGALADAANVSISNVLCKDQFLIRLNLNLTDGRSFTVDNASSYILGFRTFFSSPFCYIINVVDPIATDSFLGSYIYESVLDGPSGPTFGPPRMVTIERGHSTNVRYVNLKHNRSHPTNEPERTYEFTFACDEVVFQKNQFTSVLANCNLGDPILLGPGTENSPVNTNDDSVFEIWFVEGYNGWDGDCGFGTVNSRIRFTKQ